MKLGWMFTFRVNLLTRIILFTSITIAQNCQVLVNAQTTIHTKKYCVQVRYAGLHSTWDTHPASVDFVMSHVTEPVTWR